MIFEFLKKQKKEGKKRNLIKIMLGSLNIDEGLKKLYFDSIDTLEKEALENLFRDLTNFTEKIEIKRIEDISKENFSRIDGMKIKEAEEKKKDLNSFQFLLNNF